MSAKDKTCPCALITLVNPCPTWTAIAGSENSVHNNHLKHFNPRFGICSAKLNTHIIADSIARVGKILLFWLERAEAAEGRVNAGGVYNCAGPTDAKIFLRSAGRKARGGSDGDNNVVGRAKLAVDAAEDNGNVDGVSTAGTGFGWSAGDSAGKSDGLAPLGDGDESPEDSVSTAAAEEEVECCGF